MGLIRRLGSFIAGGLLGAGVGAAVAMVVAPQSGDEFVEGVERRVDQVKRAGLEAQARTEEELIRRFRAETGDPDGAARPGDAHPGRNRPGHRRSRTGAGAGVRARDTGAA